MEVSQKKTTPYRLLLILTFILLIFAYTRWQEVVIHHPDGSYSVDDLTTEKATDRVDRLRHKTEFYKLIARSDGYFECPLCPPEATRNGRFFLYFRELYKYGIVRSASLSIA